MRFDNHNSHVPIHYACSSHYSSHFWVAVFCYPGILALYIAETHNTHIYDESALTKNRLVLVNAHIYEESYQISTNRMYNIETSYDFI